MWVSELTVEQIAALPDSEKEKIIFCDMTDDGDTGVFALLLGGNPKFLQERCRAAADLYLEGRVQYVVPSGGVSWDLPEGKCTEAEYMMKKLMEMGVPEDAIVLENEARTTKENMLYATIQMYRKMSIEGLTKAYIVTSQSHMRRSLRFAQVLLPSTTKVAPCAAKSGIDIKGEWYKSEAGRLRAERELYLIKDEVDRGGLPDFEI